MNLPGTKAKILVTDDDPLLREMLHINLEREGYDVIEAEDGQDAMAKLDADSDIRLVLTDLAMPRMDGFQLIEAIRKHELHYRYIIVLTSFSDRDSLIRALSLGADDFLTKPVYASELKLRIEKGKRLLRLESHEGLIFSMAKLAEYRSEETGYHLERVYHFTRCIARSLVDSNPELELTLVMADEIATVSPLHDLGKVAIPDHILHKPGKLTAEEWKIMQTHTTIGGRLIRELYDKIGSSYLWLAYEIAMFHHEHFNGKGYPTGIAGDEIPVSAKILTVADVYDAISSKRCYKDAISHEEAKKIIIEQSGTQFDPRIVEAFIREEQSILEIRHQFQDGKGR